MARFRVSNPEAREMREMCATHGVVATARAFGRDRDTITRHTKGVRARPVHHRTPEENARLLSSYEATEPCHYPELAARWGYANARSMMTSVSILKRRLGLPRRVRR